MMIRGHTPISLPWCIGEPYAGRIRKPEIYRIRDYRHAVRLQAQLSQCPVSRAGPYVL